MENNMIKFNNRMIRFGNSFVAKQKELIAFTTVWDTRNLNGTGSSPTNTVLELPIYDEGGWSYGGQRYDFTVYWGDGTSSNITSHDDPNRIHTYSTPGIKELKITGKFGGFFFHEHYDKSRMLLEIKKWNSVELDSIGYMFVDCINLEITATDAPLLLNWLPGHGNTAYNMFGNNHNIKNSNFIGWDIRPLMTQGWGMAGMFDNTTLESPNFTGWNINEDYSNVQNSNEGFNYIFDYMGANFDPIGLDTWVIPASASGTVAFQYFFGSNFSNTQIPSSTYDIILNAWSQNAVDNNGPYNISISFAKSKYTSAASAARQTLTNTYGWSISDDGQV